MELINDAKYENIRLHSSVTKDQNIERQLAKMCELGIQERDIFIDKMSGKNFDRPQYQALKSVIRAGDLDLYRCVRPLRT